MTKQKALLEMFSRFVRDNETATKLKHKLTSGWSWQQSGRITIPTSYGYDYIKVDDIIHCEADTSYTRFYLNANIQILSSKNLMEYEKVLSPYNFYRVHKSHLINLARVSKYIKEDGGYIVMDDGKQIEIARRKKSEFLSQLLNSHS